MVRAHMRLFGFCMNNATLGVRVRTPPQQPDQTCNSVDDSAEFSGNSIDINFFNGGGGGDMLKPESESGNRRRIMVVVGSSHEAKGGALQWALSHTVQSQDTVILLHVTKPSKQGSNSSNKKRAYDLLCSMADRCQMRRPGVHVEIAMVEGNEKGPTIVDEAKQQRVSLLVLGQRKQSVICRLRKMWTGKRNGSGGGIKVVEYCIQNASCMTVAVRRKRRRYGVGGYLITTKRHKNFWLLA